MPNKIQVMYLNDRSEPRLVYVHTLEKSVYLKPAEAKTFEFELPENAKGYAFVKEWDDYTLVSYGYTKD